MIRIGFIFLSAALLFTSCSTVRVIENPRPIAYDDLPKSALNSNGVSESTDRLLDERDLKIHSRRSSAEIIAALEREIATAGHNSPAHRLALAELCLVEAEFHSRTSPDTAIGYFLAAAEHSFSAATGEEHTGPEEIRHDIYNYSTGQVATRLHARGHDFDHSAIFPGPDGAYTVVTQTTGADLIDPRFFDTLKAADRLVVRGFRTRSVQHGVGAALVGHREVTAERRVKNPFLGSAGMGLPVTATLDFENNDRAVLRFHDIMVDDSARLAGKTHTLGADFTAPLGSLMHRAPDLTMGFKAALHPVEYEDRTGVYFMEPIREDKIPVILVHGLLSHPATWAETFNELIADPIIRENYQFWFYLYPTGNPIGYSAAGLRRELGDVRGTYPRISNQPDFKRTILIGHSMGGLVSSLQIREGGDDLWYKFFEKPIDEIAVDSKTRRTLRESVYFTPNTDITRVVFVATPHRGSALAQRPAVRWISKLIEAPFEILSLSRPELVQETTALGQAMLDQGLNGVSGLRFRNPRLEAILSAPIGKRVTYHSIIGNRGKDHKPLEKTSDGVVPYVSAHLDGAASEKIVPSHHGAHQHPQGIAEIRRILLEHLK